MSPRAACLVIAIGNPSRGDDAFGPLLAERLLAWRSTASGHVNTDQEQVDIVVEQQCQVEHILDMQGRERVLFIDAAAQGPTEVQLQPLHALPVEQAPLASHACSPAQLLTLHTLLLGEPAPAAYLLSLTGQAFELGAPLSRPVQSRLDQAWDCLMRWLREGA
jgi:hydrogenase maturation protease